MAALLAAPGALARPQREQTPVLSNSKASLRRLDAERDTMDAALSFERKPQLSQLRRLAGRLYGSFQLVKSFEARTRLKSAGEGSTLYDLVASTSHLSYLASRPFVSASWNAATRIDRMIDHCNVIDLIGSPFDLRISEYVEIIAFPLGDHRCRFILDRPQWMQSDGLMTAALWVGGDRIFSISFCLSDVGNVRTAYVGGVQGRRDSGSLDLNRALTKAAFGMRPIDLAFELFRMLLPSLGPQALKCVDNGSRYQKTRRACITIPSDDKVLLDYDELWLGRGGVLGSDGFFTLPMARVERASDDIPARKRILYRQRYEFLRQLEVGIQAALAGPLTVIRHAGA